MNNGVSWTTGVNYVFGYGWLERGEIDWFSCRGNCEEIEEIKEEFIKKYQDGKDYFYSLDEETSISGKVEKYNIHNEGNKERGWLQSRG